MNLLARFNTYQKERFPLAILVFTTIAVVLSSAAVTSGHVTLTSVVLAFISGMTYLFHIRVVDEVRDHTHDVIYHESRPIPRGIITIKELQFLDAFCVIIFLSIGIFFGKPSLIIAILCLLYTYIAGKEFFLGEKIRARFFFYNAINLVQMLLLQFFVYSLFSNAWFEVSLVWTHLIFIFINAVSLEILRKIKIAPEESVGHDTYSWHIGFSRSLQIFFIIACIDYLVFIELVLNEITPIFLTISGFFMLLLIISTFLHGRKKSKKTENFLYLSALGLYIALNLIIYFII